MRKAASLLMMLMLYCALAFAQTRTVTGTVRDAQGNPVPFATVTEAGTRNAVTADANGSYSIKIGANSRLAISATGYAAQTVDAANATSISLVRGEGNLEEVVVTAMGIRRSEKALGYAVSKVDPTTVLQKSEPNILNNLAGKVPGVDIRAGNGAPGAASRIQIRGVSSLSGGDPLIVVDGVPYSNPVVNTSNAFTAGGTYSSGLSTLDPNDIESINVLKGAAAASLYGSRAANGVLLITTKSGAPRKGAKALNVSYRAGYSIEKIADIPEYQNTYGSGGNFAFQGANGSWGERFGQGRIYGGGAANTSTYIIGTSASGVDSIPATTFATMFAAYPELFPNGKAAYKAYPNNVSDLFKTGSLSEHSIGLNGGSGNSLFNVTLSNVDQKGYILNSSYKRNNFSVGGQTAVGNLTIGASTSYAKSKQVGGFVGAAQSFVSMWARTFTQARNWDIAGFPTQNLAGQQIGFNDGQYTNPIWAAYHNVITTNDERVVANLRASYKFSSRIRLDFQGGVNNYSLFRDQIIDKSSYGGPNNLLGNLRKVTNRRQEIQANIVAVFNPKVSNDFSLDFKVGSDINERTTNAQSVLGIDFVIPGLFNLENTRTQQFAQDDRSIRRLVGVFADATLGYKNFAFLNLTGRTDITSTLPYKNAQYFYPGISGSVVWTDALGLNLNWLDYGKFRAGYARVGNDAGPHNGEPIFGLSATGFLGQPLAARGGASYDPDLTPEFTTELELGTDLRLFKQRLGLELTWYDKRSTDLIYAINLPQTTGFTSFYTNLGEIRNTGWEAALDVKAIRGRNFQWDVRGILTRNVNTVEKLVPGLTRDLIGGLNYIEAGFPYGYLRGDRAARSEDGQLLISALTGIPLLDPNETMIGDPNADYKFGITNTLTYKGFSLNMLFDATIGGDFYSESIQQLLGRGVTKDTEDREKNRVITGIYGSASPVTGADGVSRYVPLLVGGKTVPNQTRITTNDLFFQGGANGGFAINGADEFSVFDGTVYRLRELALGYSLPKQWISKLKMSNATLSLTGRNLWYLAPNVPKYTNFDPDVNNIANGATQGVEIGAAPSTKRYGINLNITF
jgi:TonB-linked SusC/RagA family outer membrane protein